MFLGGSACVAEVKIEIGFSSFFTKIPLLFHCDMLKIYLHIYITNILRLTFWSLTSQSYSLTLARFRRIEVTEGGLGHVRQKKG